MIDLEHVRAQEAKRWQDALMMARVVRTLEWYHVTVGQLVAEVEALREELRGKGDRPKWDS